jgi:hypothetical protein
MRASLTICKNQFCIEDIKRAAWSAQSNGTVGQDITTGRQQAFIPCLHVDRCPCRARGAEGGQQCMAPGKRQAAVHTQIEGWRGGAARGAGRGKQIYSVKSADTRARGRAWRHARSRNK